MLVNNTWKGPRPAGVQWSSPALDRFPFFWISCPPIAKLCPAECCRVTDRQIGEIPLYAYGTDKLFVWKKKEVFFRWVFAVRFSHKPCASRIVYGTYYKKHICENKQTKYFAIIDFSVLDSMTRSVICRWFTVSAAAPQQGLLLLIHSNFLHNKRVVVPAIFLKSLSFYSSFRWIRLI